MTPATSSAWAKITPVTSEVLGIKTLPDALAYIECELVDLETLKKTGVCIGKAVNITVKEELWDEEHSRDVYKRQFPKY